MSAEWESEVKQARKPEHEIQPLILNRWSPRALSGEALSEKDLMPLFEAAKWAPSSFNNQPWRFIYALRGSSHWDIFFSLLVEQNQVWAKNAGALIVLISRDTFEFNGKLAKTHSFDTGAAWQNFALEGSGRGLVVHAMQGFDYDKARQALAVPEGFTVECMIAAGKRGRREGLPPALAEKDFPNTRKPLKAIVMAGKFQES